MVIPELEKIKTQILNPFVALLLGLAVVYFLYGVVRFIVDYGNETARAEGKKHMIWGIVGLAIMISVYGIINLISNTIVSVSGVG